jgi:hypothetical protein
MLAVVGEGEGDVTDVAWPHARTLNALRTPIASLTFARKDIVLISAPLAAPDLE